MQEHRTAQAVDVEIQPVVAAEVPQAGQSEQVVGESDCEPGEDEDSDDETSDTEMQRHPRGVDRVRDRGGGLSTVGGCAHRGLLHEVGVDPDDANG